MCRMSAITATDVSVGMRQLFFNQLMLLAQTDDNQKYGAGVSDGVCSRKSSAPYSVRGMEWINQLDHKSIWMGHVRKASQNTGLTHYESHPFYFPLGADRWLYAMHNGGIYGFDARRILEPDVDSYRAFKELVPLMQDNDYKLDVGVINAWTATFGDYSEWTFMFMQSHDKLTIVRGHRPMHYVTFGNGLIFNTSKDVLLSLKDWVTTFWRDEIYRMGKIESMAEFTMAEISVASKAFTMHNITKPPVLVFNPGRYITVKNPVDGEQLIK